MVFVELTPFVRFREEHWTDDELRAPQSFLLVTPTARDVIRGTGGLRKMPWSASGCGKRGGARVIYYLQTSADRTYLHYGYVKAKQEDLTPQRLRVLAVLMKEVDHG
jgi:hypothetical protein